MKELKEAEEVTGLPLCIDDGTDEAPDGDFLVLSKKGVFRSVHTDDIDVVLPLDTLPGRITETRMSMKWKGPKIPSADLDFLCNVMWDVYLKRRTEIGIHLWYSSSTGFWYLFPAQVVSATSTDWDTELDGLWVHGYAFAEDRPPMDARRIGCFHSHHVMAPEWSDKDNYFQHATEYGIQLVAGWMDKGRAIRSRLAFSGKVMDVPLEEVVDFGVRCTLDIPDKLFVTPGAPEKKKKGKKDEKDIYIPWGL